MINKIGLALKSRTFWTLVVTLVINAVNANIQWIPAGDVVYVNGVLFLLATYFHVNPSQTYAAPVQG